MSAYFCVVLSCVGRGLTTGLSPVQGVPQKCLKVDLFLNRTTPEGPNSLTFALVSHSVHTSLS